MTNSQVQVRTATTADLPQIAELLADVAQLHATARPDLFVRVSSTDLELTYLERYFTDAEARIFVAEHMEQAPNESILGIAQCVVRRALSSATIAPRVHVHIENLVVVSTARRLGIGQALMAHVENWAQALNIPTLELTVFSFNTPAQRLYEALGYTPSSTVLVKHLDLDSPS